MTSSNVSNLCEYKIVKNKMIHTVRLDMRTSVSEFKELCDYFDQHHQVVESDYYQSVWHYKIRYHLFEDIYCAHKQSPNLHSAKRAAYYEILYQIVYHNKIGVAHCEPQMDIVGSAVQGYASYNSALEWWDVATDGVFPGTTGNSDYTTDGSIGSEATSTTSTQDPTIAGESTNLGQQSVNTVITADTTVNAFVEKENDDAIAICASSTEPLKTFDNFLNRWMNVETIQISNDSRSWATIRDYNVYEDILSKALCNANVSPFESYAYCRPNMELQISCNGVRMYAGKIIVAYQPYMDESLFSATPSNNENRTLYSWPHVEVDLDAHNTAILKVPFLYPRTFVRNTVSSGSLEVGERVGRYAWVRVALVDQIRIGSEQSGIVNVNIKARFVNTKFAGIASRVPLNTFSAEPQINTSRSTSIQTYVSTRMDFASNVPDIVQQCRLDPNRLTSFRKGMFNRADPQTVDEIIQQWGYVNEFTWAASKGQGSLLFESRVQPSDFNREDADNEVNYIHSPLEVMSKCFAFWHGPVEFMFKCISSQFHTGELMVSCSFGRDAADTECQAKSAYNKYFVLGSQKTFNFVAPYIHANPWRRTHNLPWHTYERTSSGQYVEDGVEREQSYSRTAVNEYNEVRLRVHVVTPLNYISAIADEIKILVYARAAPGFKLTVPIVANTAGVMAAQTPIAFPFDLDGTPVRALPQLDTGMAEVLDPTPVFNKSSLMGPATQTSEDHNNIYNLLKRPVVFSQFVVPKSNLDAASSAFWIPITPCQDRYNKTGEYFSSIDFTLYSNILNMYRFWRGSLRFVFEFQIEDNGNFNDSDKIIIQHLPHSGIEIVGQHPLELSKGNGNDTYQSKRFFYGTGLAEVHVHPKLQRTVTVEVPYYSENNWSMCTNSYKQPVASDPWRDVSLFNAGHIRLFTDHNSQNNLVCTAYVSVADDFILSGYWFGGIYSKDVNRPGTTISDNHGTQGRAVKYLADPQVDDEEFHDTSEYTSAELNLFNDRFKNLLSSACVEHSVTPMQLDTILKSILKNGEFNLLECKRIKKVRKGGVKKIYALLEKEHITMMADFSYITSAASSIGNTICDGARTAANYVIKYPGAAIAGASSVVTPMIATAYGTMKVASTIDNFNTNVENVVDTMESVAHTASTSMTQLTDVTTENIGVISGIVGRSSEIVTNAVSSIASTTTTTMEHTSSMLTNIYDELMKILKPVASKFAWLGEVEGSLTEFFFDFLNLLVNMNVTTFSLTVVKFLIKFKIVTKDTMFTLSKLVQDMVAHLFVATPQADTSTHIEAEERDNKRFYSTLCGILVAVCTSAIGVSLEVSPLQIAKFMKNLTKTICGAGFWSIARNATMIFENILSCVNSVYQWCLRKIYPDIDYTLIFHDQADKIKDFVEKAQVYSRELNRSTVTSHPKHKMEFFSLAVQAMQIKTMLASAENPSLSRQIQSISKVCDEVLKKFDESASVLNSSPVRYEPFVICITGASDIGKSYTSTHIVSELLKSINYQHPNPDVIYVRNGASQFWDGFNDQPVVMYDDWMQLKDTESMKIDLDEFFKLKSNCVFVPNQAALSDKEKRANPFIVFHLCNEAFPDVKMIARHPEAIYRRRDALITMSVTGEYVEGDKTFAHTRFQFHKNGSTTQPNEDKLTYTELLEELRNRFVAYHEKEVRNVTSRFTKLKECMGQNDVQALIDPFSTFVKYNAEVATVVNNGFLPTEIIGNAIHNLVSTIADAEESGITSATPQFDGVLTVTRLIKKIIAAVGKQCYRFLGWDKFGMKGCCVCHSDEVMSFADCVNSVPGGEPHRTCFACYSRLTNRLQCPLCREPDYHLISTPHQEHYVCSVLGYLLEIIDLPFEAQAIRCLSLFKENTNWIFDTVGIVGWIALMASTANPALSLLAYVNLNLDILNLCYENLINQVVYAQVDDDPLWQDCELPEDLTFCADGVQNLLNPSPPITCYHWAMNTSNVHCFDLYVARNIIVCREACEAMNPHTGIKCKIEEGQTVSLMNCGHQNCAFGLCYRRLYFIKNLLLIRYSDVKIKLANARKFPNPQIPLYLLPSVEVSPDMLDMQRQIQAALAEADALKQGSWWDWISDIVSDYWKEIIMGIGLLLGSIAAFKTWTAMTEFVSSFFGNNITQEVVAQSSQYTSASQPVRLSRMAHRIVRANVQMDVPLLDVVEGKIIKNSFILTVQFGNKEYKMRGVGLKGNHAVFPQHYVRFIEWQSKQVAMTNLWYQSCRDSKLLIPLVWEDLQIDCEYTTDLCVVTFPRSIPMFINLIKYMPYSNHLNDGCIRNDLFFLSVSPSMTKCYKVKYQGIATADYSNNVYCNDLKAPDCLTYNYQNKGECGSFIIQEDGTTPILAMHVAGNVRGGFGVFLTRDTFEHLLEDKPIERCQNFIHKLEPIEKSKVWFPDECQVDYMGTVTKEMTPYMPRKSKIVPSLINGIVDLPIKHEPSILSRDDERYSKEYSMSPLVAGCAKHGKITGNLPRNVVEIARTWCEKLMIDKVKPIRADLGRLSLQQAVVGIPGLENYPNLDLNTSAGWPYSCVDTMCGKKDWINPIVNEQQQMIACEIHPRVLKIMQIKEEQRLNGIVPATVFEDHLKDETLHVDKVRLEGKTRVFCMSPIDFTIQGRQSYLDFCAAFTSARIEAYHGVGIACDGWEWNKLYNRLVQNGNNIMCMDYSNFGPGFNVEVGMAAFDVINYWYSVYYPSDQVSMQIRNIMKYECCNSVHVCENLVYAQQSGSPSGSPITTYHNSVVNLIYIMCAYILAMEEAGKIELISYAAFVENVYVCVYGDDMIVSVKTPARDFNMNSFQRIFNEFNIKVTGSAKTNDELPPFIRIEEAEFLKRMFVRNNYRILAPLNIDSIYSCSQYVRKMPNMESATLVNAEAALRLSYAHGKRVFDEIKGKINAALSRIGLLPLVLSWEEIDLNFFPVDYQDPWIQNQLNRHGE